MLVYFAVSKPGASMLISYFAGSRFTATYVPPASVSRDRCEPVPVFLTVTLQVATTLPEGSFTVPVNDPKVDCACAVAPAHIKSSTVPELPIR